jgi:DNA primase
MDRDELTAALEKIDVETYLDQEGVQYNHSYGTRGLQLNLGECPACGEGGRKTYINAETGLGNCFHGACNFKFNKFKLIQKVSGLSGRELDGHIGATAENQGWMPKKERKTIVYGALTLPTQLRAIPENGRHLRYLEERGVTEDSALYFQLKYCHKGWWGYEIEGEAKRWVSYDKRVIIPIADLKGELVSFQGRDVSGVLIPKYLFPTGYAVAGSHIYNGQNFQDGVHTHAIVGEGAFDAIAIHQALMGHASCGAMIPVATFGMHLSSGPSGQISKFLELKDRGLKTVTFMWDGEAKAMAMAVKAGMELTSLGLRVQIAQLPEGFDPAQGPDSAPTPPDLVRKAIFNSTFLSRMSAVKLLIEAGKIVKPVSHA